jgi:hypothetical protein
MDESDFERIKEGIPHCIIHQDFTLECKRCKHKYKLQRPEDGGFPIWFIMGVTWGFAYEHGECEEYDENQID